MSSYTALISASSRRAGDPWGPVFHSSPLLPSLPLLLLLFPCLLQLSTECDQWSVVPWAWAGGSSQTGPQELLHRVGLVSHCHVYLFLAVAVTQSTSYEGLDLVKLKVAQEGRCSSTGFRCRGSTADVDTHRPKWPEAFGVIARVPSTSLVSPWHGSAKLPRTHAQVQQACLCHVVSE